MSAERRPPAAWTRCAGISPRRKRLARRIPATAKRMNAARPAPATRVRCARAPPRKSCTSAALSLIHI
eukprot:7138946-Alexandrium_andersonii.AAC.1